MSKEYRAQALVGNIEEVWAAVDILGYLNSSYGISSVARTKFVQSWEDTTILIWKQFQAACNVKWEDDVLYRNVITAFERLKKITTEKESDYDWIYDSLDSES